MCSRYRDICIEKKQKWTIVFFFCYNEIGEFMKELKIKKFYNSNYSQELYGKAIDKVKLWKSEEIIFSTYVNKEDAILDLGCGAGRTTINLWKLGYHNIIGVDISRKLISFAKKYCKKNGLPIYFKKENAMKLSFHKEFFDIVFFSYNGFMTIPKKENRIKALQEIYRVLKPNGLFIFTAHNRDDLRFFNYWEEEKKQWEKHLQSKELYDFGDRILPIGKEKSYIHLSNNKEIKELLKSQQFEVIFMKARSEIWEENKDVLFFSDDTNFWVAKR